MEKYQCHEMKNTSYSHLCATCKESAKHNVRLLFRSSLTSLMEIVAQFENLPHSWAGIISEVHTLRVCGSPDGTWHTGKKGQLKEMWSGFVCAEKEPGSARAHWGAMHAGERGIACILWGKHVDLKCFVGPKPKLIALYFLFTENKSKLVWDHYDLDAIRG